jgi:NCK adaptor protein
MSVGGKCVAKFQYQAVDGEELTIAKGEILTVEDDKGTWWKVRNQAGRSGLVPSNYVEVTSGPASISSASSARTNLQINEPPNQYQQPDLMVSRNGPSLNIRCLAKFKYTSTREDELSLEKGDEVIVMEKEADGWWRGRCGTRIGWFPFNYVEEAPKQPTAAPPQGQVPQQQSAPPMASKNKSFVCGVIALYSFNSGNPEELPFEKGDFMDIIDQPPDDPDWWEARKVDGSTGLVPRNYVEVVHDAEPVFGTGKSGGGAMPRGAGGMGPSAGMGTRTPAPFAREAWFYGKVARRDAEGMLNRFAKNGEFIVRESETKVSTIAVVPPPLPE